MQSGNWAEWVGGAGTIAAVLIAAVSVRQASRSARDAQDDRAYDEAKKVQISFQTQSLPDGSTRCTTTVRNQGKRPISEVTGSFRQSDGDEWPKMSTFSYSPPCNYTWQFDVAMTIRGHPIDQPDVGFTDSNGRRWRIGREGNPRELPHNLWTRSKFTKAGRRLRHASIETGPPPELADGSG